MSGTNRVHYFDGQFLGVADFAAEQDYQLAQRRRHQTGAHSWGIVGGLGLSLRDGKVLVEAGYAVDGYGRDLVLAAPRWLELPAAAAAARGTGRFEVWLSWNRRPVGEPPAGRPDAFARWDESPDLAVTAGTRPEPAAFAPWLDPPDDPAMAWPVRLGAVAVDPAGRYVVDSAGRRPAGLIAHEIVAPAGDARLVLGAAAAGDDTLLALRAGKTGATALRAGETGATVLRLAAGGALTLAGTATLNGGATLGAGTLAFAAAGPDPDPAEPGFRLRRAVGADGVPELRIELAAGGRLTIGAWSESDKALKPALTVGADGAVAVAGNLVVNGEINPLPVPPPVALLSADGRQMVKSAQLAAASQRIAQALAPPLPPLPPMPPPPGGESATGAATTVIGDVDAAVERVGAAVTTVKSVLTKLAVTSAAIGGSGALVTLGATLTHFFPETSSELKPLVEHIRAFLALIPGHG